MSIVFELSKHKIFLKIHVVHTNFEAAVDSYPEVQLPPQSLSRILMASMRIFWCRLLLLMLRVVYKAVKRI